MRVVSNPPVIERLFCSQWGIPESQNIRVAISNEARRHLPDRWVASKPNFGAVAEQEGPLPPHPKLAFFREEQKPPGDMDQVSIKRTVAPSDHNRSMRKKKVGREEAARKTTSPESAGGPERIGGIESMYYLISSISASFPNSFFACADYLYYNSSSAHGSDKRRPSKSVPI